jgi:hypothetical protein
MEKEGVGERRQGGEEGRVREKGEGEEREREEMGGEGEGRFLSPGLRASRFTLFLHPTT